MSQKQKFQGLNKRLLSAVTILLSTFFLIYYSSHPLVKPIVFLCVIILSLGAIFEFHHLLRSKNIKSSFYLMSIASLILLVTFYFVTIQMIPLYVLYIVFATLIYLLFLCQFPQIEGALAAIASHLLVLVYIIIPLIMLLAILYISSFTTAEVDGRIWLLYLILTTKFVDIGGYFFGKLYGKKPLALGLSPKKTLVGAISGFVCALLFSSIFWFIMKGNFSLDFIEITILGAIIAVFSQVGDLAESLLKRDAQVKDSNSFSPEIGGVLDIIDSLIFTAPILFFYLIIMRMN